MDQHIATVLGARYGFDKLRFDSLPPDIQQALKPEYCQFERLDQGLGKVVVYVLGYDEYIKLFNLLYKTKNSCFHYEELVYCDDGEVNIEFSTLVADILTFVGLIIKSVILPEKLSDCLNLVSQKQKVEDTHLYAIAYQFLTGTLED